MSELHKALGDIGSIRRQMAHATEFRGYGPATMAVTGVIALAAAVAQWLALPDPAARIAAYLAIWIAIAIVSAAIAGVQMYTRSRRIHSGLSDEMIHMAVEQFLPSGVAGLLVTVVLLVYVPTDLWLLPGLWQIVFGLGIFSSCRFLPRPMVAAGAWYLFTGLACISLAGVRALSPWAMGIPFCIGQLIVAAVLFFNAQEVGNEDQD
jgi:hypothetical protein